MRKYTNEFKAGLFIILCILGLVYITYSTGKLDIRNKGYNIYVAFDEISGLENKAPVMLNGLEVGKVEEITPVYDNDKIYILLKLWIKNEVKVGRDARVSIKTLGLMGEKYVQISSHQCREYVLPGQTLSGRSMIDIDVLMEQTSSLGKKLDSLIAEIKSVSKKVNNMLGGNMPSINRIISNLESTSNNFEELSADLKRHPWKLLFKTKDKKRKR